MDLDELKKLQTTMQDAARSFEHSVTSGMNAAESELQNIAKDADPTAAPALPAPEAPAETAAADLTATAAPEKTPQLELELSSSAQASQQEKRA